jgi:ubiquinone/menaquinone biosynthesis C-methylase UbiE
MPSKGDPNVRMREDWEARASASPYWFVDARTDFERPDVEGFFRRGEADLVLGLEATGYRPTGQERVLELGCGAGRMTWAIADRTGRVVGVDISEGMLKLARTHLSGRGDVSLVRTDGSSLAPFRSGSVDLVISNAVFQHLPTVEVISSYLRETARVLRGDGVALIGLQNWTFSPYRWARAATAWTLNYHGFRDLRVYTKTFLGVRMSEARVRQLFSEAGLAVERFERLPRQRAWVRARKAP